ncbi:MAG TPA: surface-adhesin E family protein [Gemmatimonadaceae bacterium]|jgi:hypothetical protein|nr:surface-adhesin E family protein [Gemmatimonadaceae bacterium]
MRTLARALLLLVSAGGVLSAQGQWKEVGKTSAGNSVFVDPSSVKIVNGIVTARVRVKFATPVAAGKDLWYASHHIAMFDCAKSAVAAKQTIYYGNAAETKIVEKKTIAMPGYGPAIGGSMTKVALDYLCTKR